MHTKTPHGHHRSFKIKQEDFPEGIKEKSIVKLDGHNEIAVKGRNHYLVERGEGYEIVNRYRLYCHTFQRRDRRIIQNIGQFQIGNKWYKNGTRCLDTPL